MVLKAMGKVMENETLKNQITSLAKGAFAGKFSEKIPDGK